MTEDPIQKENTELLKALREKEVQIKNLKVALGHEVSINTEMKKAIKGYVDARKSLDEMRDTL